MKITVTKQSARVWEWRVAAPDGRHLAAGYCRTKADAINDAAVWTESRSAALYKAVQAIARAADGNRLPLSKEMHAAIGLCRQPLA